MVAFDETRLRKAFDKPAGSLNDFIQAALGLCQFSSPEQRVERAFTAWVGGRAFRSLRSLGSLRLNSQRDDPTSSLPRRSAENAKKRSAPERRL